MNPTSITAIFTPAPRMPWAWKRGAPTRPAPWLVAVISGRNGGRTLARPARLARKLESWEKGTVTRDSPLGDLSSSRAPAARGDTPTAPSTTTWTPVPSGVKGSPSLSATSIRASRAGAGTRAKAVTTPWGTAWAMAWANISRAPSTPGRSCTSLLNVSGPTRRGTTAAVGTGAAVSPTWSPTRWNSTWTACSERGELAITAASFSPCPGIAAPTGRP